MLLGVVDGLKNGELVMAVFAVFFDLLLTAHYSVALFTDDDKLTVIFAP